MKTVISIAVIVLVVLGLGYFLFKVSPNNPAGGNGSLSDFDLAKTVSITGPRPVSGEDYVLGNPSAKNTAVVYEDFECPACATFAPTVEQLPSALQDTKVVFRHFPLQQHTNAVAAAYAGEAAGAQGKFWEMYKLFYANQDQWANLSGQKLIDKFAELAQQAGVPDINKFKTDIQNKIRKDKIQADITEGYSLRLQGTPSLYFNGKELLIGGIDKIKSQAEPLYNK